MGHPLILTRKRDLIVPERLRGLERARAGSLCVVGAMVGAGGRRPFSLASTPGLLAWYEAVDVDATLVKAVQPTVVNGDFVTDTDWSKGTNWSISGGQARCSPDPGGTSNLSQPCGTIVGNRYAGDLDIDSLTAPLFKVWAGSSGAMLVGGTSVITTAGAHALEGTAGGGSGSLYLQAQSGGTVTLNSLSNFRNLSRVRWNSTAGSLGGYLSQASAAYQPWWNASAFDSAGGVHFETTDFVESSLAASAWKTLHSSATIFVPFYSNYTGAVQYLFDTLVVASTNVGIGCWFDGSSQDISIRIGNGSGSYVANITAAGGSVTRGAKHILEASIGSSYDVMIDGAPILSGSLVGLSTSDPSATLRFGGPASNSILGDIGDSVIVQGQASPALRAQIRQYLAAKYGISLP